MTSPESVMRPMPLPVVNHTLPSGPGVVACDPDTENVVTSPPTVIPPIRLPKPNQNVPSGPTEMPDGEVRNPPRLLESGRGNSVIDPSVVMRPMTGWKLSVNQSAPSGPSTMSRGEEMPPGIGKSTKLPLVS